MTATTTGYDRTAHDRTAHDRTAPASRSDSIGGTRTANLTPETPLLAAAVATLIAGVLAVPDVALLLLGIPAAVLLAVGTIATAARFLSR